MEGLAPPLKCLIELKHGLKCGQSLHETLRDYIKTHDDNFCCQLKSWLILFDQNHLSEFSHPKSPYRSNLFYLIEQGLNGNPILNSLCELEVELTEACHDEIDRYIATLPFKAMIPVMFLQVPAFLLLLLGPLMMELFSQLGG